MPSTCQVLQPAGNSAQTLAIVFNSDHRIPGDFMLARFSSVFDSRKDPVFTASRPPNAHSAIRPLVTKLRSEAA